MADVQNFHSILVPARVYTGDRAELRCTFTSEASQISEPIEQELSYEAADVSVYALTLSESVPGTYALTVSFQVWQPGTVTLPELTVGPFTVNFPAVTVFSIAETGRELVLQPMRPPLVVPGTSFQLYFMIISSVVAITVAAFLARYFRRTASARALRKRSRRRLFRVRRSLAKIRRQFRSMPSSTDNWCADFERTVREYLAAAFPIPAAAYTTAEITRYFDAVHDRFVSIVLPECADNQYPASVTVSPDVYASLAVTVKNCLADLFGQADRVRFGGDSMEGQQYMLLLASFERLLADCERLALSAMILREAVSDI